MSSRAQRQAAQQAEQRRRKQRRWLLSGIGILALLVIGGLAYRTLTKEDAGRAVPTLGNQHLASGETPHVLYNTCPPTSGPHLASIARWGIHTQSPSRMNCRCITWRTGESWCNTTVAIAMP
jgi:hypothetical protein